MGTAGRIVAFAAHPITIIVGGLLAAQAFAFKDKNRVRAVKQAKAQEHAGEVGRRQ